MATLQEAEQSMKLAEQGLQQYEDPSLSMNVQKKVMESWSPLLNKAASEASKAMAGFGEGFAKLPYGQYVGGTEATDLPPQAKVQAMLSGASKLGARVDKAGRLGDYFGGKAQEMAQRSLEAMRFGHSAAAQKFDRARGLYQTLWEENEREKERQFQAQQAAAARAAAARQAAASQYQSIQGLLEQLMAGQGGVTQGLTPEQAEKSRERISGTANVMGLSTEQLESLLKDSMGAKSHADTANVYKKYIDLIPKDQRTRRNEQNLSDIVQGRSIHWLRGILGQ
jgi:hypothetical protein